MYVYIKQVSITTNKQVISTKIIIPGKSKFLKLNKNNKINMTYKIISGNCEEKRMFIMKIKLKIYTLISKILYSNKLLKYFEILYFYRNRHKIFYLRTNFQKFSI